MMLFKAKKPMVLLLVMSLLITAFAVGCSSSKKSETASGVSSTKDASKSSGDVQYPTKPITIVVPFAAGGGTDAVGRAVAESLKGILKQEVVVENKVGGGGSIGMMEALNAKPDGYTLTVVTREVTSLPLLGQAPFKTMDFKFIGCVNVDPSVLVVPSSSKYKDIQELVSDIKASPDKFNFAASVTPNYYGLQFAKAAGLKFVTVPFNGAAPAITELLGGRAQFGIYGPAEVKGQVEAGTLRPLAVMDENRFASFKDVPTFKEKGIDIVSGTYRGLAVNPKTPEAITKKLEDALAQVPKDQKFIDFMNKSFLGIGYKNSADFKASIEKDIKVLEPIIAEANKK